MLTNMFAIKDPSSTQCVYIQNQINKCKVYFKDDTHKYYLNKIYVTRLLFQVVPKEVLDQWEELNNTKVKLINGLNAKDLVKNPFLISSMNDSFLAQHQSAFGMPDDDEKINRCFNELKQEIKISCVQEFGLSENNITTFTQDW